MLFDLAIQLSFELLIGGIAFHNLADVAAYKTVAESRKHKNKERIKIDNRRNTHFMMSQRYSSHEEN